MYQEFQVILQSSNILVVLVAYSGRLLLRGQIQTNLSDLIAVLVLKTPTTSSRIASISVSQTMLIESVCVWRGGGL